MDYVLNFVDSAVLTPHVYGAYSGWTEDDIRRQFLSLTAIATVGGYLMYFATAFLSFCFIYDRALMTHPLILKNQIRKEIMCASSSIPIMGMLSSVLFVLEVRGYSKLYDDFSEGSYGWLGSILDSLTFLAFTDTSIYWIHRALHSRLLYAPLHKAHHRWKVPTPFASHAFHPVDGFLQSLPYHAYVFLFPLHKRVYLLLFVLVNLWTVSIHDGDYRVPRLLRPIVNGAAHHMDHHLLYNCNYGQFFTFWDRLGGSFHHPQAFEGKGPTYDVRNPQFRTKFKTK